MGLRSMVFGTHLTWARAAGSSGWAAEIDEGDDAFFQPIHLAHVESAHPAVLPYLALPPGWRFQVALDHEDVWFDESLLAI